MKKQHPNWSINGNIYEVNLRQYTVEGTFEAFAKHLPRLKDMGVKILWFMPITPISEAGRLGKLGSYYAVQNYKATNPEFGSMVEFKNLVNQAHELNFKVIVDFVANHTGNDHHWIKEHPEFYITDNFQNVLHPHGWDDVSQLNYDNAELRLCMIDALKFWVKECGIDGYRCDMAHLVPLDFWEEATNELSKIDEDLFWLAECEVPEYHNAF
ncbi:MAG: alpha-amylase family glycosyl hydrolase, partial [Ginsengibacter sp.]